MSQVIKNPSPKGRFVTGPALVTAHRKLWEDPQLQMSLDFAMLQYQASLTENMPTDTVSAASVGLRMKGAMEFLTVFRLLAETPNLPAKADNRSNLDHHA